MTPPKIDFSHRPAESDAANRYSHFTTIHIMYMYTPILCILYYYEYMILLFMYNIYMYSTHVYDIVNGSNVTAALSPLLPVYV